VRHLIDRVMLSIMSHENATVYGHGTATNNHAVAQNAKYIARELLKAEALGGFQWIRAGQMSQSSDSFDFIESEPIYRQVIADIKAGELPGHRTIVKFLAAHGTPLSEREVKSALIALKGTDLEQSTLAEAHAWASREVGLVEAERRRQEEEARRKAEEAERKRQEAEERARRAEEARKAAAEEAQRRAGKKPSALGQGARVGGVGRGQDCCS
jgi:hypothetical protein